MADEITFGYSSGRTLTYGSYNADGTPSTAAGTALPEEGVTGYYHATDLAILSGDVVIVTDSVLGVVAWGEFAPFVDGTAGGVVNIYNEIPGGGGGSTGIPVLVY